MKIFKKILISFLTIFVLFQIELTAQWIDHENGIYYPSSVGVNGIPLPYYGLTVNGTTRSNGFNWGENSILHGDQGGAIELGSNNLLGETPYIDFHYGLGSQDFNTRIMNSADNRLDFLSENGAKFTFDGKTTRFGYVLPSLKVTNNFLNGFTSGNSLIFQNANGTLGIDFWKFGTTNGVMNFYADYINQEYNQFSIKTDNTCGWGNDMSWLSAGKPNTTEGPSIHLNQSGNIESGSSNWQPYISFAYGITGSGRNDVVLKNSAANQLDFLTNTDRFGNDGTKVMSIKTEGVYAKKLTVQASWSDFVFKKGYHLISLTELEKFISENGHLPEIPDENYVKENGVELGEMTSKLLQKIEELSLYVIELNKQVELLKKENSEVKSLLINK